MKNVLVVLLLLLVFSVSAQKVIPMVDFNGFFNSFQNGVFRQISFQPIQQFKFGDNVMAFYDYRGNLLTYDGTTQKTISNIESEYTVSDNLITWKIATTLNLWDNNALRTLSYQVGNYQVSDSLVVFQDMRYNSVSAYYNGEVHELYTSVGDIEFPDFIGENIVAFRDNGNFYKVFWRGQIYELDVWHDPFSFRGGTDMIAFNDPINGTFAIFENGQFSDVELQYVSSYKVGNGFVVYENQNGELLMYKEGEIVELSNFRASFYDVRDNIVLWSENSFLYTYHNGEKVEVERYVPNEYAIKNDVIVYRNIMGGVTSFINGVPEEITNQTESSFSVHGNAVLVELFNKSYIVLQKGKNITSNCSGQFYRWSGDFVDNFLDN